MGVERSGGETAATSWCLTLRTSCSSDGEAPRRRTTKKHYRGINNFVLSVRKRMYEPVCPLETARAIALWFCVSENKAAVIQQSSHTMSSHFALLGAVPQRFC